MARDYYYLKEVLLGLREEYLKNEEKLRKLKSYVICEDDRVEDFYFWLFKNLDKIEFWIDYEPQKNRLDAVKKILDMDNRDDFGLLFRDKTTHEIQIKHNKYHTELNPIFIEQLDQDMDKILETDFVKEGQSGSDKICCALSCMEINKPNFNFSYYAQMNEHIYLSANHFITKNFVQDVLATQIPRNYFPEYHQYLIERQEVADKEIEITDKFLGFKTANLEIQENDPINHGRILISKRKTLKK